ncbi:MAG: hypothetical protein KatS3mg026_1714 [Bacteroidia bacterium]|nr:MAG: hypothetical protein KatS3mg026_1714 [Bacteroidia bacterium]
MSRPHEHGRFSYVALLVSPHVVEPLRKVHKGQARNLDWPWQVLPKKSPPVKIVHF